MSGEMLLAALVFSLVLNGLFFLVAVVRKTDVVTDLSYSLTFFFIALFLMLRPTTHEVVFIYVMVVLWAIRLGTYLFPRILVMKKDKRFDGIREKPLKFAAFWLIQAVAVWVIMFPVILTEPYPASGFYAIGVLLWAVGLIVESIADAQKFRAKKKNPKKFVSTGLWKYSRHPNYFGELLVWWGIYIAAMCGLKGWLPGILGPIGITVVLLFMTGIPPLERRWEKQYGNNPAYKKYKKSTSILIPWPPRGKH